MANYKQLCAELLVLAEESISYKAQANEAIELIDRARAALSEPEPEGPTDEELLEVAAKALDYERIDNVRFGAVEAYGVELVDFARAVLARWGNSKLGGN